MQTHSGPRSCPSLELFTQFPTNNLVFSSSAAVRNAGVAAQCGGVKVLLNAVLDPNGQYQGIQESLVLALIYLLNEQDTRRFIRPGLDLGVSTSCCYVSVCRTRAHLCFALLLTLCF